MTEGRNQNVPGSLPKNARVESGLKNDHWESYLISPKLEHGIISPWLQDLHRLEKVYSKMPVYSNIVMLTNEDSD